MSTGSHRLRESVLTVGAIAGALCFAVGIATFAFGVTPLVVESGSMSPTIKTGALAIARDLPAHRLRVGDIVCIKTGANVSVTHRIVKITHRPGSATIRLKGDANKVPDAQIYTVKHAGRILFSIPFAGRIVAAAGGPIGLLLLGAYTAFVAMILIDDRRQRNPSGTGGTRKAKGKVRKSGRRKDADTPAPPAAENRPADGRRRSIGGTRPLAVAAVLLGGVISIEVAPEPTFAAWTDGVDVGTSTLSTYTVPAPVVSCGTLSVGTTRLNWTAVTGATSYTLNYGAGGGTTENVPSSTTSKTFSGLITSGVFSVKANINYGSTTWTSVSSNKKNYTVLLIAVGICTDA